MAVSFAAVGQRRYARLADERRRRPSRSAFSLAGAGERGGGGVGCRR